MTNFHSKPRFIVLEFFYLDRPIRRMLQCGSGTSKPTSFYVSSYRYVSLPRRCYFGLYTQRLSSSQRLFPKHSAMQALWIVFLAFWLFLECCQSPFMVEYQSAPNNGTRDVRDILNFNIGQQFAVLASRVPTFAATSSNEGVINEMFEST